MPGCDVQSIEYQNPSKVLLFFTKLNGDRIQGFGSQVFTSDVKQDLFEVLETLFYTKDGWSDVFKVKSLARDENRVPIIVITNSNGEDIITTREYVRSLGNPNIGWIPSFVL